MSDDEVLEFSIPHLKRMFPGLSRTGSLPSMCGRRSIRSRSSRSTIRRRSRRVKRRVDGLYIETMARLLPRIAEPTMPWSQWSPHWLRGGQALNQKRTLAFSRKPDSQSVRRQATASGEKR